MCPECEYFHAKNDQYCRNCGYALCDDAYNQYQKKILESTDEEIKELHEDLANNLPSISPETIKILNMNDQETIRFIESKAFESDEIKTRIEKEKQAEIERRNCKIADDPDIISNGQLEE